MALWWSHLNLAEVTKHRLGFWWFMLSRQDINRLWLHLKYIIGFQIPIEMQGRWFLFNKLAVSTGAPISFILSGGCAYGVRNAFKCHMSQVLNFWCGEFLFWRVWLFPSKAKLTWWSHSLSSWITCHRFLSYRFCSWTKLTFSRRRSCTQEDTWDFTFLVIKVICRCFYVLSVFVI